MTFDAEQVLPGFVDRIVRVGDTVRRPSGWWTPATAALLQHYERVGFGLAPRHLGFDSRGREIVSFISGCTVNERTIDTAVLGAAVRRLHDAGRGFTPPTGTQWQDGTAAARADEVYCHNDLGPWNILGTDAEVTAFIDFDHVAPKQPVWELADLTYRFGPLYADDFLAGFDWHPSIRDRASRIAALLRGYGRSRVEVEALLSVLVPNLQRHVVRLLARAEASRGRASQVAREGADVDAAACAWTKEHLRDLGEALRTAVS